VRGYRATCYMHLGFLSGDHPVTPWCVVSVVGLRLWLLDSVGCQVRSSVLCHVYLGGGRCVLGPLWYHMAWANIRGCHSFTLSLWMWTYVGRVLCDLQVSAACPVQCVHLCLPVCAFLSLFILYVSVFFACRSIAYVWWVCDNPELRCNRTMPEKILG
jgi:hypothetical protein